VDGRGGASLLSTKPLPTRLWWSRYFLNITNVAVFFLKEFYFFPTNKSGKFWKKCVVVV
jgi:hypothetical protein